MKYVPFHLPVFQKFDCHSCGYCCRNLVVNVTSAERQAILDAGWRERLGGQEPFVEYRFRGRKLRRLAHRADGACVFLGDDGLCRIHAESGVAVKPLACRMYPFVPTPGAGSIRVDMRADCPSVAGNRGRSLSVHRDEIAGFVEETHTRPMFSKPEWRGGRALSEGEFDVLAMAFEGLLSNARLSFRDRLRAGTKLLDLLYLVKVARLRDDRFVELLHLLSQAVVEEAIDDAGAPPVPVRAGRLFRQWLFLHAIADDPADLQVHGLEKYRRSWRRYGQSRQFAAGVGLVPPVRPDWPQTTFEAVAAIEPADDAHLEPLVRSMRVKLDAHAFCGPGYYGRDVLHGLTALWLLPAVAGWLARMAAARSAHPQIKADDLMAGLRQAHHTFGVSPVFARISEKLRLHALARPGVPAALLGAYGP